MCLLNHRGTPDRGKGQPQNIEMKEYGGHYELQKRKI